MTWIGRRFQQRRIASMTDPVAGTLQVTAASFPPVGQNAMYSDYTLTGVVSGPGVPPTAVQQHGMARVSRWPQAGSVLPVTVDRAQPARFVITWDQVPSAAQQALAQARNLALHEQTNLDFGVMRKAVSPDASAPDRAAELPADEAPGPGPSAGSPVPGTVVAVYPVPVPGAFAPPGGVWDLSVQTADRTVLVRASCDTNDERARIARVGATVTVALAGSADVATLID